MKISVYNTWDHVPKAEAAGEREVVLSWDGEYRVNDVIEFDELEPDHYYVVRVDATMESSFVYITEPKVLYTVPFYEKRASFDPVSFAGCRHYISIRRADEYEVRAYRNLALNPFDQHDECGVYPHASANIETRGESVFAARNAIDGIKATRSHGEWPYESWGINRRDDACFRIDFGRPVDIDMIRLYTRADFPHDNWWVSGRFTFSDGATSVVEMDKKSGQAHEFELHMTGITYLTLDELIKADDPSPFPALTQIEVFGTNH